MNYCPAVSAGRTEFRGSEYPTMKGDRKQWRGYKRNSGSKIAMPSPLIWVDYIVFYRNT